MDEVEEVPPSIPVKTSSQRNEKIPELPSKKYRNTLYIEAGSEKPAILSNKPRNLTIESIPILPDKRKKFRSEEEINQSLGIVKKAPVPIPRPVKQSTGSSIENSPKSPHIPINSVVQTTMNIETKSKPNKPPRNNLKDITSSFKPSENYDYSPYSPVSATEAEYIVNNFPFSPTQQQQQQQQQNSHYANIPRLPNIQNEHFDKYKARAEFFLGKPAPPPRASQIPALYLDLDNKRCQPARKSLVETRSQFSRSSDDIASIDIGDNGSNNDNDLTNFGASFNNSINPDKLFVNKNKPADGIKVNANVQQNLNQIITNPVDNMGKLNDNKINQFNSLIKNIDYLTTSNNDVFNNNNMSISDENIQELSNSNQKLILENKMDLSVSSKLSGLKDLTIKSQDINRVKQLADLLANQLLQNQVGAQLLVGAIATPFNSLKRSEETKKSKDLRDSTDFILEKSTKISSSSPNENNSSSTNYDSDDQLSDGSEEGGDDVDNQLEFSRPSIPVLLKSIPIVANQPHLITERKGYLYKYTSQGAKLSSKLNLTWQKKWATLDSFAFRYFNNSKSGVSRKVIPVCTMCNVKQDILLNDQHPFQFKIFSFDKRVFIFSAETADDLAWWTNMVMRAIIGDKAVKLVEGGDMNQPEMQGYAKIEGFRGNQFLAKKKAKFCIYNSYTDFKGFSPIHMVDLQLANVKDVGKFKLQMKTPQATLMLCFDSQEELTSWRIALEAGISYALGDDEFLNKIYTNLSNRFCADCQAEGPEWVATNFGITLCKNCAGIHRKLPNAKVRSMRMDSKVWKRYGPIELMFEIGNSNANKFWSANLVEAEKIDADSDITKRDEFIHTKYVTRSYADLIKEPQAKLNQMFHASVQTNNIPQTMRLLYSGAQLNATLNNKTALQLAEEADQKLQIEFLKFNSNQNETA